MVPFAPFVFVWTSYIIKILEHTQRKTVKKIRITSTLPLTKFRDVKKGARDVSLCSKYIASDETKTK